MVIYLDKGEGPVPLPFLVTCYMENTSQSGWLIYKTVSLEGEIVDRHEAVGFPAVNKKAFLHKEMT